MRGCEHLVILAKEHLPEFDEQAYREYAKEANEMRLIIDRVLKEQYKADIMYKVGLGLGIFTLIWLIVIDPCLQIFIM